MEEKTTYLVMETHPAYVILLDSEGRFSKRQTMDMKEERGSIRQFSFRIRRKRSDAAGDAPCGRLRRWRPASAWRLPGDGSTGSILFLTERSG